jgi:hypothetical protein
LKSLEPSFLGPLGAATVTLVLISKQVLLKNRSLLEP